MNKDGKLIFSRVNKRRCAILMQNNTLMAASFQGEKEKITGGIYIARIRDIVKNLNACFAEIQPGTVCFLPDLQEQIPFYLPSGADDVILENRKPKQGDLILVQVIREAQKTKQPAVTTRISLSNRFFVVALGNNRVNFSTKLTAQEKANLRQEVCVGDEFDEDGNLKAFTWVSEQEVPYRDLFPPVGIIFRTECREAEPDTLRGALKKLLAEMTSLLNSACYRSVFTCMKTPPSPWQDAINHFVLPSEYQEIVTDDPELFEEMQQSSLIPSDKKLRFYDDPSYSMEKLYSLSSRLESALSRKVWLKSGAYLVIEPTEALTVIDVNSGKCDVSKGKDEYYAAVNLEAAREIAYQIRLRNLSGMILVDFINMTDIGLQETLITEMQNLLKMDRVKTCVIDFTKLGLMEITRQKTVPPLLEQAIKYHYPIPKG